MFTGNMLKKSNQLDPSPAVALGTKEEPQYGLEKHL